MADKTPPINLNAMTVEELTALRDAAEAKRREKLDLERDAILAEARAGLAKLGLTLEGSISAKRSDSKRSHAIGKVAIKYRGPKGEEWSGRGRLPQWVTEIEGQGKTREEFLIKTVSDKT